MEPLGTIGPQSPSAPPSGRPVDTARAFEAMMLGEMVEDMFATAMPADGANGLSIWRGYLARAVASEIAEGGSLGIAPAVEAAIRRYADGTPRGPAE